MNLYLPSRFIVRGCLLMVVHSSISSSLSLLFSYETPHPHRFVRILSKANFTPRVETTDKFNCIKSKVEILYQGFFFL